ncbi:MAG TPA: sugar ABC transporter permease [Firmicutes bacterium]|jgi:multiple sugar transport system permease protein|nr:sugar ABC transporter permease [Bacillota bacterium]
MRKAERLTYLFVLPAVVVFALLTVYPLIYAIVTGFYKIDFIRAKTMFYGFQNYAEILTDDTFWVAVKNTLLFVVLAVVFETLLGTLFALFFNSGFRFMKLYRTVVLVPMLLPPITVALTWKMMYDYNFGIFNFLLKTIGLSPVEWLSSTDWALLSVVLTDIWQWTPFVFLVILASLQSIPLEIYESAQVEGASYVQSLRYITLPLLRPALALVLLLRTIDTFRVFDKMYVLTGGGPGNATETITYYIYRYGFRYFQTGYAAAASIIMVIMVLILSIPYIKQVIGTADFQRNAN